jgi:L-fuconolactonase
MAMKIVDSQVHIWYPDTPERPWPPATELKPQRERPFTLEDLLPEMKAADIDRAIIVPPGWEGCHNDRAIEAARVYPGRLGVMGRFQLNVPESREKVATWKQQPGVLGMRLTFARGKELSWLSDGTADWFWPAAEKAGLGVMIYTPGNLPPLKKIAERHPGLKLIIDHMGIAVNTKDDEAFRHIGELCDFARYSNVAVKASGLPCYSTESYPYPKFHPYVKRAYDAFGPKRLFWGSDFTRQPCCYALCKTMFTEEMKWFTIEDLEWIMGRGVCDWLGWPL